jgi:hypothetical protein
LPLSSTSIFNDLALGGGEGKEKFKFEGRQLTRELL